MSYPRGGYSHIKANTYVPSPIGLTFPPKSLDMGPILVKKILRLWGPGMRVPLHNKVVLEPRDLPAFVITYFCNHCNIRFENTSKYVDILTFFSKNLNKRSLTPRWPLTQVCWGHMCDSTQVSLCPSPTKIHQSMWIQWPFFKNLNQSSLTPRWPLIPCLLRSHVWLYPNDHCVQVPRRSLCPSPTKIYQST